MKIINQSLIFKTQPNERKIINKNWSNKPSFVRQNISSLFAKNIHLEDPLLITITDDKDAIKPWWRPQLAELTSKMVFQDLDKAIADSNLLDIIKLVSKNKEYLSVNLLDEKD